MRFLADKSGNFMSLLLDKLGIKTIRRRKRKRNQVRTSIPPQQIDLTGINNKIVFIKDRRARVRWKASASPNVVGYKLYWAIGGGVNYESDFAENRLLSFLFFQLAYNCGKFEVRKTLV
jgi:hypothetical protein